MKKNTTAMTRISVNAMAEIALMTAVLCILSPISVPIGPVPVSMSLFAVFLAVYVLGQKRSLAATLLYILIGFVGMPVFSGYAGGIARLFGPTGGYIFGYLAICWVSGWFIERFPFSQWYMQIFGMLLGLLLCYTFGTLWFMLVTKMYLSEALALCVYPFLAFDTVKLLAAFFVGNTVKRALSGLSRG